MQIRLRICLSIALVLGLALAAAPASATLIDETLAEFNGASFNPGDPFPLPPVTVGTFTSIPMGESLVSGTISGTFGNSVNATSAGHDLFLGDGGSTANDVLVAQCVMGDPCFSSFDTPWSHTFTAPDLAILAGFTGPLVLTAVQTSEFNIRLAETRLVAESVPEPGTALLLAGGLLCLQAARRRYLSVGTSG